MGARVRLRKLRNQMLNLDVAFQQSRAILAEAGLDISGPADLPGAIQALVELARDGRTELLEPIDVQAQAVDVPAQAGGASAGTSMVPFTGAGTGTGTGAVAEQKLLPPPSLDLPPGFVPEDESLYVVASGQDLSASGTGTGTGREPMPTDPAAFAERLKQKIAEKTAKVNQQGVKYGPPGLRGGSGGVNMGRGAPKISLDEQKAIMSQYPNLRTGR